MVSSLFSFFHPWLSVETAKQPLFLNSLHLGPESNQELDNVSSPWCRLGSLPALLQSASHLPNWAKEFQTSDRRLLIHLNTHLPIYYLQLSLLSFEM